MNKYRCPVCGTNMPSYPMLVSHNPRALCAHESHQKYISLILRPSLWAYLLFRLGEL